MRIYTRGGDLPHEVFFFPDGQPHFKLLQRDGEWPGATIEAPIRNANELLLVMLAAETLKATGKQVNLDIRYLMGARMDRRIDHMQPFTLSIVTQMLMMAGLRTIRILDPHSEASTAITGAYAVYPVDALRTVLFDLPQDTLIIAPDKNAEWRTEHLLKLTGLRDKYMILQGEKHRDPNTGRLSGFDVENKSLLPKAKGVLIVDDLLDGGGTFSGLSKVMLDAGAPYVDLFITHGIFSKGTEIEGIRQIYCTDSFSAPMADNVTVFPVSMKDMKD